jgi:hypothetical protein
MASNPPVVIVHPCVLSYPHLFVPQAGIGDNGKPSYSCELWFYEGTSRFQENVQALHGAIMQVCTDKWGKSIPQFKNPPLRTLESKPTPPAQRGYFVRAKSFSPISIQKPSTVVRGKMVDVEREEEVYAGVIVAARLGFSVYDGKDSRTGVPFKGVSIWLNHVLLLKDGPRLGRQSLPAEEAFGSALSQMEFGTLSTPTPEQAALDTMFAAGMPPGFPPAAPPMPGFPAIPQQQQDLSAFGIPL